MITAFTSDGPGYPVLKKMNLLELLMTAYIVSDVPQQISFSYLPDKFDIQILSITI
jgi:hypothetical protein